MTLLRLDDFFISYGDQKYAELGIVLDLLRSLLIIHQGNHWTSQGSNAYSDHLLFERLYTKIFEQIDKVGEKAVGLGSADLVSPRNLLANMPKFLVAIQDNEVFGELPQQATIRKALLAEKSFITAGEKLMNSLDSKGLLTRGLEQLLGTLLDEHEEFVYLLKQRMIS